MYRLLFLFFGYEFLPWLRITVVLITYVMQAVSFVLLDLLLCIMTCICTILCYSVFENVSIIISSRFEKSEVFINHISESRNRDFCFRKSRGRGTLFLSRGDRWMEMEYLRGVVIMEDIMFLWFKNFISIGNSLFLP